MQWMLLLRLRFARVFIILWPVGLEEVTLWLFGFLMVVQK